MSTTTPTISPVELQQHLVGVDELEDAHPLTRRLPRDTPRYRIDYHGGADGNPLVLEVELRVILNRPDQLAEYDRQLLACKVEALEWLRSVGADPAYRIEWNPPEAASL